MTPYSDEYLTYDFNTHHYILTEKAMLELANENLTVKLKDKNDVQPFLRQVSTQVYNFIHQHNACDLLQDYVIATTEKGRQIIRDAMIQQAVYVLANGNLRKAPEKEKRELWFDPDAEDILLQVIPEIGTTILYTGSFHYLMPNATEW